MSRARFVGSRRTAAFALFAGLGLALTGALRSDEVGVACIDLVTVAPAGWLIDGLFPADGVIAQGPRLVWPGGRMTIRAGCDGLEVLTLYVAAVLVAPVSWRRALGMLALGGLLVWLLNQCRLLALYLALRHWPAAFDAIHVVWAPLLLLAAVFAAFAWQLRRPA